MQYKMQFTVLDDAVKQNRKLPEIAFFDTDGNLIHLGGGGGGGSVDLSHLTELGFGSPTDAILERNADWAGLRHPAGPDSYANFFVGTKDKGNWELYADDGGVEMTAHFPADAAAVLSDFKNYSILKSLVAGESDFARFNIDATGEMSWGDGTGAPDSVLYRAGGFGPGYGVLSADAGGGFIVRSSAPGAEYSFTEIISDSGYGSYVWIHNMPGHTDQDALYFDVEGELNPRFTTKIDGSMQWGDGTTAPDVSLERAYPGALGVGEAVYLDGLSGQVGVYPASDLTQPIFAGGLNGGSDRYQVLADGSIHWGNGTDSLDVSLDRVLEETGWFGFSSDPAALRIDSPIKFHERGGLAEDITLGWTSGLAHRGGPHPALAMLGEILHIEPNGDNPDGMWLTLAADPIGGNEVGLYLGGPIHNCEIKTNASGGLHYQAPEHKFDQQISIAQPGAGIKLTSPDGSQTKIVRLSNAGALELV